MGIRPSVHPLIASLCLVGRRTEFLGAPGLQHGRPTSPLHIHPSRLYHMPVVSYEHIAQNFEAGKLSNCMV